jgi:DNA polymerase III subunit alpha
VPRFVHLHVHSAYSLLEGALPIGRLAELAKADRQPALALTDTDNMFGALEFSEKLASSGIQPIVGCALALDFGDETRDPRLAGRSRSFPRIVLLAAREDGLSAADAAQFARLPRNAIEREAACQARVAGGRGRGADRIDRRAGRAARYAFAAGQAEVARRAAPRCRTCSATGSTWNCSATAHRPSAARDRTGLLIDWPMRGIPLVATNEPFFPGVTITRPTTR